MTIGEFARSSVVVSMGFRELRDFLGEAGRLILSHKSAKEFLASGRCRLLRDEGELGVIEDVEVFELPGAITLLLG